MRLGTFRHHNHEHAGVFSDDYVISLKRAGFEDTLQVISGGSEAAKKIAEFVASPPREAILPLDQVTFSAPIPRPGKILCVGLNYRSHAQEAKASCPRFLLIRQVAQYSDRFGHRHRAAAQFKSPTMKRSSLS